MNLNIRNEGPIAPKDPRKKRPGFYIIRGKEIAGSPQPDGRGVQFLYQDEGRMVSSARIVGNITDEKFWNFLKLWKVSGNLYIVSECLWKRREIRTSSISFSKCMAGQIQIIPEH